MSLGKLSGCGFWLSEGFRKCQYYWCIYWVPQGETQPYQQGNSKFIGCSEHRPWGVSVMSQLSWFDQVCELEAKSLARGLTASKRKPSLKRHKHPSHAYVIKGFHSAPSLNLRLKSRNYPSTNLLHPYSSRLLTQSTLSSYCPSMLFWGPIGTKGWPGDLLIHNKIGYIISQFMYTVFSSINISYMYIYIYILLRFIT